MQERLEKIKAMYNNGEEIHQFDIEWLIRQAKKVESLEHQVEHSHERIYKLSLKAGEDEVQNKRYEEALKEIVSVVLKRLKKY